MNDFSEAEGHSSGYNFVECGKYGDGAVVIDVVATAFAFVLKKERDDTSTHVLGHHALFEHFPVSGS